MSAGPLAGATCLRPEAVKWAEALEPDERDPRILGEGPCHLNHEPRTKYDQNRYGVWLICKICAVRLHYAPKKGAPQNTISLGPTPEVVRAAIAGFGNTPVGQIDFNRFRGMINIEQGRRQAQAKSVTSPKASAAPAAAAPNPKTALKTVPKAQSKPKPKARPSKAPEFDLTSWGDISSEPPPEEEDDSPALDRWSILMRRVLRKQRELEETIVSLEQDFTMDQDL